MQLTTFNAKAKIDASTLNEREMIKPVPIEELIRQLLLEASEYKLSPEMPLEDHRPNYVVRQPGLSMDESVAKVQKLIDNYQLVREKGNNAELELLLSRQEKTIRTNWRLYLDLVERADSQLMAVVNEYVDNLNEFARLKPDKLGAEMELLIFEVVMWGKNFANPHVNDLSSLQTPKLLSIESNAKQRYVATLKSMKEVILGLLEAPQKWMILNAMLTSDPGESIKLKSLPWEDDGKVYEFRVLSEEELLKRYYESRIGEIKEIGAEHLKHMVLVCKGWHGLSPTERTEKTETSKIFLSTIAEFMADGEGSFSKIHAQKLLKAFDIFILGKKGKSNQDILMLMSNSIRDLCNQIGLHEK